MPYKINSAIVKKDEKTGKYDLIDTEGKYGVEEILMVIDSDDLITMQLLINAILNNDFKAWKEINWEDGDNIKSLLIKLGYGRDDILIFSNFNILFLIFSNFNIFNFFKFSFLD